MAKEREKWEPLKIETPPLFIWPPKPLPLVKYIFGYPGYFLPRNICYMALALFTWFFLTPSLVEMKTFQLDWIAFIYGRNLILMFFSSICSTTSAMSAADGSPSGSRP